MIDDANTISYVLADFQCRIIKHPSLGYLCGHLRLPTGHPWHGKNFTTISSDVHGGLTYSSDRMPHEEADGGWWIGFHCAHAGDFVPGLRKGGTVRDKDFVRGELAGLAQEAINAQKEVMRARTP